MKRAFTLAEILLTLAIIGTIAAITIPAMLNISEEAQIKAGVREIHSILAQVAVTLHRENSYSLRNLCPANDNVCIRDKFAQHLSVIKKCGGTSELDTWGNCFTAPLQDGGSWKQLDGTQPSVGPDAALVLSKGMLLHFYQMSENCTSAPSGSACTRIIVDVNGFRKPNITGQDIFYFWMTENALKPANHSDYCGGAGSENAGLCKTIDHILN